MTRISFKTKAGALCGFCITGHSTENAEDVTGKIVCSAVSSAAYMAANTITEIVKDKCEILVSEAEMSLYLKNASQASVLILEGLRLHLTGLEEQYPKRLNIITEV